MGLAEKKTTEPTRPTIQQLSSFIPLNSLDNDRLFELSQHARIVTLPVKAKIFNQRDIDSHVIFLAEGSVLMQNANSKKVITSKDNDAHMALDPSQPRNFSAIAVTEVTLIYVERNLLDILLTWDPYTGYQVDEINDLAEIHDQTDWMATILKSRIFHKIPPIKIQVMFQKLETVVKYKNEIIFSQDDPGDYFYLIKSGSCLVVRTDRIGPEKIVHLGPGSNFGEEALLSNSPRNATVIMNSDGVLLRLNKSDFEHLFVDPVIEAISLSQAKSLSADGAKWIDVRQEQEHLNACIADSINIPLNRIRESMHLIPRDTPCIVYCDTGHRSACAAYLLNAYGYAAYVLEGGTQSYSAF